MASKHVADGWRVDSEFGHQPGLVAAGVVCGVTHRGELMVDLQDGSSVAIPLAAISALVSAHEEWLKRCAEARKEAAR